jgi:hypothetical protein
MPLPTGYVYYVDPQDTSTITGTNPVTNIAVKGSVDPNHQFTTLAWSGLQSGGTTTAVTYWYVPAQVEYSRREHSQRHQCH